MAIKPILFNTEMVKAILEGRKTQTRRIIRRTIGFFHDGTPANTPPFARGDVLWVREAWNFGRWETEGDVTIPSQSHTFFEECEPSGKSKDLFQNRYVYRADAASYDEVPEPDRWHPSIHMPKEAARIFLHVDDVRAERLQSITIQDLQAEGILPSGYLSQYATMTTDGFEKWAALWNSTIHPKEAPSYSWNANPWVWVIEFERIEGLPAGFFGNRDKPLVQTAACSCRQRKE